MQFHYKRKQWNIKFRLTSDLLTERRTKSEFIQELICLINEQTSQISKTYT